MSVSLRTDERGVSEVIGAVLLFGMLIIAFATYQASIIPGQNTDIEAQHYQEVQGDLGKLQGTIVTAAESGEARSASVNLGPSYPSRALGVNAGPASGQLRAESVGSGQISSGEVPLDETCRLQDGGPNTVPTNALVYEPGYNYYESGDVSHRLEETLLYQTSSAYGSEIARIDQSMVDPAARSVTFYPLQSDVQSGGTGDETYRFVGGYGQGRTVSDATVTIPTRAPVSLWRAQIADGNPDITVANNGPETIDIIFAGDWEFNCLPVGQDNAPEQVPTADAGTDTSVPEGSTVELDGTQSQASGSITAYSWTLTGSAPAGVSLSDSDTATPVFDASDAGVDSNTAVTAELTITDANGRTDSDSVTVTVTQTSNGDGSGSGGSSSGPSEWVGYVNSNAKLAIIGNDDTVETFSVGTPSAIGPFRKNVDGDGNKELPFVNANDNIEIVDRNGNTEIIDDSTRANSVHIGSGDWDNDPTVEVVYVRDDSLYSASSSESASPIQRPNGNAFSASSVAGIGDIDGDGSEEIVYVAPNNNLKYIDQNSGGQNKPEDLGVSVPDSNAVGRLADFDDDGTLEVPYYNGASGIEFADQNEQRATLTPETGATAAPIGAFDYVGDSTPEIIYVGNNNNYIRYVNPDNGNSGIVKPEQVSNNVGTS